MEDSLQEALSSSEGPLANEVIEKIYCLSGQAFCKSWRIELKGNKKLFAKSVPIEGFTRLKCEAEGLQSLRKFADREFLKIPNPICIERFGTNSYLLLPWLNLDGNNQKNLGKGLALLHKSSLNNNSQGFGWGKDSFIGAGPQPGGWKDTWGECFVELRLKPQLKIAQKWGIDLTELGSLLSAITSCLDNHNPCPSLVHGDLWSGNAGVENDGKGILIDPATWWADREVDIAMTKLFGGFKKEFYAEYECIWPLPKSSKSRVEIYNLYHVLNHANLFGGSYKQEVFSSLNNLKKYFSKIY